MDKIIIDNEASKKYNLFQAAYFGDINLTHYLLEKGLDIDSQDEGGDTALHYAARRGYNPLIRYLLERRAKISLNKKNRSALLEAYANDQSASVKIITKFSLERNSVRNLFQTYLLKKIEMVEQQKLNQFINECKKHIRKNYLNRSIFNRFLAKHTERAIALTTAFGRCGTIKEVKELIDNQFNLLKGVPTKPIPEYLLAKRWSTEIKNKPKNVDKSCFYKTLKTLSAAPNIHINWSQGNERAAQGSILIAKKTKL